MQNDIAIPVDGKTECTVIKIVLSLYVSKCVAFSVPIRHKDITCNRHNHISWYICEPDTECAKPKCKIRVLTNAMVVKAANHTGREWVRDIATCRFKLCGSDFGRVY